jgi:AcrR family transcriptional regulator
MTAATTSCLLNRREARRRSRREAILAVASRSFLENGYAGTTMSGIATTLGGSKGTLWNHFPSKEELFAAVLYHATTAYRERLSQILDSQGELEPTLVRLCVSLLEKVTSPEAVALQRLVVSEAGRFPEMGKIFYEHAPGGTRRLVAQFLSGAMDQGLLRRADPLAAARILLSVLMSGCHQQLLWGQIDTAGPDHIRKDAEAAVDVFARAYAPEEQAPGAQA